MLFVQEIDLWYRKDVRYPDYAHARNSLKFVPTNTKIVYPDREVFYQYKSLRQETDGIYKLRECYKKFGEEIFNLNDILYNTKIRIFKESENYKIMFYDELYKTAFVLGLNQYGRVQYNERCVMYHAWYYRIHTINLINCDRSKFREKMFFRKVPDYEYKNMQYLRYC
ncbi:MAG: hypothetical protein K2J37_01680 [Ruminococcus sp.]|nr:hypothetical protein [Ruminococcus sp.]MDE6785232.1 hypothetical protein [Ruminococcus sp.]